jgi:hypothetical protein
MSAKRAALVGHKCQLRSAFKIALLFAFGSLYQLFIFGWLAPLAIGIYRVALRQ